MSYTDKKITNQEVYDNSVETSADDVLIGDADDNKRVFDKYPELIKDHFNDLVDALDTHDGSVDDDLADIEAKLATIEEGAEVNVQADWNKTISTADDYIKNKPAIDSGTGDGSIQEGIDTVSSGFASHSEGSSTLAIGGASHAEGGVTIASGDYSHAQNYKTIAAGESQTALGTYNVEDTYGTYAVIVGNGTNNMSRSNALTVKWNGDVNAAGDITDGNGHTLSDALTSETDPVFSASVAAGITSTDISTWNGKSDFSGDYDDLTNKPTIPTDTSDLTNGAGFLTSESDPVFSASEAAGITSTDIANWNAKLSSESDPVFTASVAHGITSTDISNWNGKLSSETDPVFSASAAAGITASDISDWNGKQDELVSGTNIKTINNTSLLGSGNIDIQGGGGGGGTKNVWYATCTTTASTQAKVASTTSNDFALVTGNMVRVLFTNANSYNGTATLNVDGTGAKDIARVGTTKTTRYYWVSGEVVDFVYDGTNFVMSAKGTATTTYYGLTKLSSSTSSTSEALAATPKAVKAAYDLADSKSDFSGSYTDLTNKPTIPTDTSDLTNGAGFITGYTETDPVFTASDAASITSSDISNWNGKLSSETDPIFSASAAAGITSSDISNWNGKQNALTSYVQNEYDQDNWHVRKWSNGIVEEWTTWSVSGTFTTWSSLAYLDTTCPKAIPVTGTLVTKLFGGYINNMTTWTGSTSTVAGMRFLTQGSQSGTKSGTAWLYLVYK